MLDSKTAGRDQLLDWFYPSPFALCLWYQKRFLRIDLSRQTGKLGLCCLPEKLIYSPIIKPSKPQHLRRFANV